MAESEPSSSAVVSETVSAAKGYRTAAEALVAGLALAPLLTALGGMLTLPEDWDWSLPWLIAAAVLLSASVLAGLYVSVRLREPVELTDTSPQISAFNMSRIPSAPFDSFGALRDGQTDLLGVTLTDAQKLELRAYNAMISDVYELATASELGARIRHRKIKGAVAIAVIGAFSAVIALLLAPHPLEAKAQDVRLVSVTLEPAAVKKLGCDSDTFDALRVGGTDDKPIVVPIRGTCDTNLLELTVKENKTATSVKDAKPVDGS
jgi:hypothetical protein